MDAIFSDSLEVRNAYQIQLLGKNSEQCNCAWDEVTHDLNTCRHMEKEVIDSVYGSPWYTSSLPDEVRHSVPRYSE
jgi:hypothetical protein